MKRFLIIATLALVGAVASIAVSPSSTAIIQFPDSTGTNMVFQVNADGTVKSDGAVTAAGTSLATSAALAATAIQPTTAAYTAAVAKATSALQPNAVATTNVIVSLDAKTNTIIVLGGQITSWVVTQ